MSSAGAAELWRALKTLKALQAEQAAEASAIVAAHPLGTRPVTPRRGHLPIANRPRPNEPCLAELWH